MIVIKILFTILLLIPVAFFMRFLLGRLSSETPKQTYTKEQIDDYDSTKKKKRNRGRRDSGAASGKTGARPVEAGTRDPAASGMSAASTNEAGGKGSAGSKGRTQEGRRAAAQDRHTHRQPVGWQRSERVPFGKSEGYRVPSPSGRSSSARKQADIGRWQKPSDALREAEMADHRKKDPSYTGVNEASQNNIKDADGSSTSLPLKKNRKKSRSEKTPSKRQLRKNRERARKRDLKRRSAERKQEGKR